MRMVKLITEVVVTEVPCERLDSIEVRSFPSNSSVCYPTKELLGTYDVKRQVVPIKYWVESKAYPKSGYGNPDCVEVKTEEGYIALSPEIDSTIGKYIEILNSEINELSLSKAYVENNLKIAMEEWSNTKHKLYVYELASLWQRIKYVFTGRVF
jgi:hypothetical protein